MQHACDIVYLLTVQLHSVAIAPSYADVEIVPRLSCCSPSAFAMLCKEFCFTTIWRATFVSLQLSYNTLAQGSHGALIMFMVAA